MNISEPPRCRALKTWSAITVALVGVSLTACSSNEKVETPVGSVFGTTALVDNSTARGGYTPTGTNDVAPVPGDTTGLGTAP